MKKFLISYFVFSAITLFSLTEKQFLSDYCERSIDAMSERLSHCYVTDLCEWYCIYGQMTAYQDIHQLVQYFEEEKED